MGNKKINPTVICADHAAGYHNNRSDNLEPQPIIIRIIRMWPITNHKNKNAFLGTPFIYLDIHVCLKNTMFLLFQLHLK